MKRIICLIITLCFTMNVFASTGTLKELELALDEYQYSMTIEWDQKDKSFQENQAQAFVDKVTKLYEQGLAIEDVNLLVERRFKKTQISEAIKLKIALIGKKQSAAELAKILQENSSEFYSSGASWNASRSEMMLYGVIALAIAVAVAHSQWKDGNYECTKYAEAEQCVDEYDCAGTFCSYDGSYCKIITRCIKEERI